MASVETLGTLERRLSAVIPQQQIRGEVEARLRRLGRTVKAPGFRPGKVPFKILEQQYGAQVQREVIGDVLQRSFAEAARANSLKVAGDPRFEIKTPDLSAPLIEYSATFEVYPEVVLGDVGGESVARVTFTLKDEDVENTLTTLRRQRAVYEKTDRAAEDEDQVRIDFLGKLDDIPFEGGEAQDYSFVLGAGNMLADFERAISGMKAGETKSFDMTFPADYHGKNVAGKEVTFTIALHEVKAPRLPELDAAFAKVLGIADGDLEALRDEIRDNLSRETGRRVKVKNKSNAMDALLRVCHMEVPKSLLDNEVQNLMGQAMESMQERGVKIPQGMSLPPDMFVEQAQKRIKLGLILAELVKRNNLYAKPEQVRALVEDYAQSFEHPEAVVKWHYSDPQRLHEAETMVLEDNVVSWLMSVARVTDKTIEFGELMGKNYDA
jgi:trigger factor